MIESFASEPGHKKERQKRKKKQALQGIEIQNLRPTPAGMTTQRSRQEVKGNKKSRK